MNNEYIKIGDNKYAVVTDKANINNREVRNPKLFELENDVEIINNEIKDLKSKKRSITYKQKKKNIRCLLIYTPLLTIWSSIFFKNTIDAFIIYEASSIFTKVSCSIASTILLVLDSVLLSEGVFSNLQFQQSKKEIDKLILKARTMKKESEKKLENLKSKSRIIIKNNTVENQSVSLRNKIDYKISEVRKELYNESDYINNSYTLIRKR